MKPEDYFPELQTHINHGGAASKLELAALEAWNNGNRHLASYLLSLQDLISSGGLSETTQVKP